MKKLIFSVIAFTVFFKVNAQERTERKTAGETVYSANAAATNPVSAEKKTVTTVQHPQDGDDPVRNKSFSKSFPASHADKVSLSNQFGPMVIKVWDKNEVKVDVSIRAYSNNEGEAQKLIDGVTIEAEKNGNQISFKTQISNGSNARGFWSRNKKREVQVSYMVYMPATNALSLSQEFGSVTMGDFSGPLSAKVQYGNFKAENLSGTNSYISVQYGNTSIAEVSKATIKQQYGSGLVIGTVATLDLDAQYAGVTINQVKGNAQIRQQYGSGLKISSVNNLDLDAQYVNVNVGTVRGNAVIKQQYNSLEIGSVGKLDLRSQYAGVNLGSLKGDGNFRMSYNNFKIAEISPACRNLTIDADYVDVNLKFADNYNGDFNVDKSYGGFKYGANVKARTVGDDNDSSSKKYTGKIGNGGNATVRIKSDYGAVVFR